MKRGVCIIAAALSAVLLTGCNRYGTDLPKEYKEFLDYTFDGEYHVELTERGTQGSDKQGYSCWEITYTDKNGTDHVAELSSLQVTEAEKKPHGATQRNDIANLHAFIVMEMWQIGRDEFAGEILSRYLTVDFSKGDSLYFYGDGYIVTLYISTPMHGNYEQMQKDLCPGTGMQLSECDLTYLAQNEDFYTSLSIRIEHDTDPAPYLEMLEQIHDDFAAYTESPLNYEFKLVQYAEDEKESGVTLYRKSVLMGQEVDLANAEQDFSVSSALSEIVNEKYD